MPERSFSKRKKHWFMQKANQKQSVAKEPRNQFVCSVKKITGETLALSMTNAIVVVAINARPSITPVCAMLHL